MAILSIGISSLAARQGARQFDQAARSVETSAKRAATSVSGLDARTKSLGIGAQSTGQALRNLGVGITGLLAARGVVSLLAGFEETLLTLRGVAISSTDALAVQEEQFRSLEDAARQAGATTRFSAREAADGLLFLARAGFAADEAISALPSTLNLAVAGVLDLGEASDIASNVVQQFGLAAAETERVSNALVRTANNANTDVRQLAEALKLAGPIAAQAGIGLEQTAAALGVLGDAGIQASLAGTNLRGVLLGLSAPTSKALVAFDKLGVSAAELNPATNDLTTIFEKLGRGLDGIAEGDRLQVLDAIFGRRNAAAAAVLSKATEKLGSGFNLVGTSAQEAAELIDTGLRGSLKALVSTTQEAVLQIGDSGLSGGFQDLIDTITDGLRVLVGLEEAIKGNEVTAKVAAVAIGGLGSALSALAIGKIAAGLAGLAKGMAAATLATKGFTVALAANPLGLFVVTATAAATAVGAYVLATREASQEVDVLADAIRTSSDEFAEFERAANEASAALGKFQFERQAQAFETQIAAVQRRISDLQTQAAAGILDPDAINVAEFAGVLDDALLGELAVGDKFVDIVRQGFKTGFEFSLDDAVKILQAQSATLERQAAQVRLIDLGTSGEGQSLQSLTDGVGGLVNRVQDLAGALPEGPLRAFAQGLTLSGEAAEQLSLVTQDVLAGLEAEAALLGLTEAQRAGELAVREALRAAAREDITLREEELEIIRARGEEVARQQASAAGAQAFEDTVRAAREEILVLEEIISKGVEQEEVVRRVAEARREAAESGTELSGTQLQELEALIAKEVELAEVVAKVQEVTDNVTDKKPELTEFEQAAKETADSIARDFGSAFGDVVFGVKDSKEALRDLFQDVTRQLFDLIVTRQLVNALAGSFGGALGVPQPSAFGNVFEGGNIVPFQNGGVFSGTSTFPLANGDIGKAFEAGPEAIVPLERGADGKLGVRSMGGSTGGDTYNVTVQTPDLDSFRRSPRNTMRDVKRKLRG